MLGVKALIQNIIYSDSDVIWILSILFLNSLRLSVSLYEKLN